MKKIMLVDDIEISNFIMKKMIEKISTPFEIFDFTDPSEAIESVGSINPDVIFLDLNMPVIDGWLFLEIMQKNNFTNRVYILTSSTSELDINFSKKFDNVQDFLFKPIDLTVLKEILQKVAAYETAVTA